MKIFYYWQAPTSKALPGYLQLCIDTWRCACPQAEIVQINLGNIEEFSGGQVSARRLSQFSYPLQSDVASAAVLLEQGGVFMDVDTIILPHFDPYNFAADRLTMYATLGANSNSVSTAFYISPHPGHPFLRAWLDEINRRMYRGGFWFLLKARLRRVFRNKPAKVDWDFLGNSIVDPMLLDKQLAASVELRCMTSTGTYQVASSAAGNNVKQRYLDYWMSKTREVSGVIEKSEDGVIFLQNSWHPQSYLSLSPEQVLLDYALVSRCLRHLVT